MTKPDDGAFPPAHDPKSHPFGLTKREYFAALAMQGLLADENNLSTIQSAAAYAVKFADALIAELNKEAAE